MSQVEKFKQLLTAKSLYSTFLHVAVIALAVQVTILSIQNKKLKEAPSATAPDQLKIGDTLVLDQLQPVEAGLRLDTTSSRQLVFIMTTLCPFCKETIPIWKDLVARVGMSVPILAISLDSKDSTLAYAKNNDVSFPLAVPLDVGQFKKKNKISGVPLTLVRENTGKVLRLWLGKLDAQKALEVERSTSTDPAKEKQP
jgi:thiol-disulfide isomerase/thioredoxin